MKPRPPASAELGLMLVTTGDATTVKVIPLETIPPGLATVTEILPTDAISDPGTAAVKRVEETNVVVRLTPFQATIDPETNPVPFTVRVKPDPPATAEPGLKLDTTGNTG